MISTTGPQTNMTLGDRAFCWFWLMVGAIHLAAFFLI